MEHLLRKKQFSLLLVLLLLLTLPSCAQMKSWVPKKKPVHTAAHVKRPPKEQAPVSAQAAQPSQPPVQTPSQARRYLEEGAYQKAIDDYSAEYRKNPQNQALVKEYAQSLDEMKTSADRASGRGDFASAGRIYSLLLGNYGEFKGFTQMLSFDRPLLNKKLSLCKRTLSSQGFQEYRKGNISRAITLWQDLLVIDPNNADIKRALKTAQVQQKNLKGMK